MSDDLKKTIQQMVDVIQDAHNKVGDTVAIIKASADAMEIGRSALQEPVSDDALRWRALMASDRIRIMGWAGMPNRTAPGKDMHMGVEFWSDHPAKGDANYPQDDSRAQLTAYADSLIPRVQVDRGANGQKGLKRPFAVRWRFSGRRRWNTHGTYKTQELAEKAAAKLIRDWKSHNGEAYVCPTGQPDEEREAQS